VAAVTAARKTASPFYTSPAPKLLGERARGASHHERRCCLCPLPVTPGMRIADVAVGQGAAHLACIGRLAEGVPR
jgi:hypothetical protein